ncbi:MAG: hypothetical protein HKN40_10365 [Winogradskyella sp.]|uniref:hypothetical protein n=1 Tax=Winogradskyella sp. TaxID=1883156 RepID=UPI00180D0D9E|nr:hypothetical protein [Winogradskyella sp.]
MIITPFLVIFIIVVFVLLYLFLKTVDKRKWLSALIALALTPFVYFYMFYPFINILSNYHHQKYFDSEAWMEKPALRYEMADHIIKSDTLVGLTKTEVSNLLGNYEWLSWEDNQNVHNENKWNYGLGIEPGAFNNHKECLEITYINNYVIALNQYQEEITFDDEKK